MSLLALKQRFQEAQEDARATLERSQNRAAIEGRPLNEFERNAVEAKVNAAKGLKQQIATATGEENFSAELQRITGDARSASGPFTAAGAIANKVSGWWKAQKNSFGTGHSWAMPAFDVSGVGGGTGIMATTITGDPASGGKLILPDTQPGIIPLPMRRLVVADLAAQGSTNSTIVQYMKQTAYTNAAAAVAEGTAKPESAMVFDAVQEPVRKIAHWIPITEEMLEDVPALQAFISAQLFSGVLLKEDDMLLNGSGAAVPPEIVGYLNRAGLAPPVARGSLTNPDAILTQIAAIEYATNLAVDGIVMNPQNFTTIQLLKDSTGEYVSGAGPFSTPVNLTLWGRRVALTAVMPLGTALVGAFQAASQLFRHGTPRIDMTNAHQDYFTKNLVAIRAEERLALAVYREAAFGKVTGLT
jgi:HK97 family phage major capsid protein